jgi:arsenate reductase
MSFTSRRPGLLFLCVANSVRSQIAEGVARRLAPPGIEVYSAGASPGRISSYAVAVLAEIGVDASAQYAKPLSAVPHERVGTVVTLCNEDLGVRVPRGVEKLHWPTEDPTAAAISEEETMEAFRRVRDSLAGKITELFAMRSASVADGRLRT